MGQNPVERILTAELLENIAKSARIYIVKIPGEALTEAGWCSFVIDGYASGTRQRIEDKLKVSPAKTADNAGEPADPTPTQAEQLQVQIDAIITGAEATLVKVTEQAGKAEAAAGAAESYSSHPPVVNERTGYWQEWDGEKYVDTTNYSIGPQGIQGPPGPQGEPFEFEDFTPEQLEEIRGPQGTPGKPPIVGDNGNWHVWDGAEYVDTGYSATALHNENGGGLVKMWFGTIAEYNALDTIYNDVLYHIIEGAIPV